MSIATVLVLMSSAIAVHVQGQDPDGYTKIADQDFVDAGPMAIFHQDIVTLQACADACTQDAQCQSFRLTSFCTLYRLRRCMTPASHDNVLPFDKGSIYEKDSPVQIFEETRIVTVCANYSGVVISSFATTVPNGHHANADRLEFTSNCSQLCSAQTSPACRSWRTLTSFENSPRIPVDLRCTLYADSIYDADGGHGYLSVQDGNCKRAQSIYGINGAATSFPNCSRTSSPGGMGSGPDAPLASGMLVDQSDGTVDSGPGVIVMPGTPSSSSGPLFANVSNDDDRTWTSAASLSSSAPAVFLFVVPSLLLTVAF